MRDEDDPLADAIPSRRRGRGRAPTIGPPNRLSTTRSSAPPATPSSAPPATPRRPRQLVAVPRLARHEIVLDDDHQVGVAVCGRGLPLVLVHGLHGRGHPLRPDAVPPGAHGLQGRRHRRGRPRRHPGPARPAATTWRPTPGCWPGCSTSSASAGPCSPATRWAGAWSPQLAADPARPGHRRGAHRRRRGRVLGPADPHLPVRPAGAAGRRRCCSWPTRCRPCRCSATPARR